MAFVHSNVAVNSVGDVFAYAKMNLLRVPDGDAATSITGDRAVDLGASQAVQAQAQTGQLIAGAVDSRILTVAAVSAR